VVDYNKDTGSSGTMRIRDTGSVVEFWINSGNGTTFVHELPWRYVVNGVASGWQEFDYSAGAGWEKLDSWTVSTSQTVTFKIGDTGTSGFGGPTTFTKFIERAKPPNPPSVVTISNVTGTSVLGTFTDGDSNGAPIETRQIGYGTNSSAPQHLITSDKSTTIGGLANGTLYYFWARCWNEKGWSAWGPRSSKTTLRVPDRPDPVTVTAIGTTSAHINFTGNGNGGSTVLEWDMYYNTVNNTVGATTVNWVSGGVTITGLAPGTTYYFWARGRNVVGWSPYSAVTTAKTFAGSYVKVGAVWKPAIPWVKVDGVWRVARPWGRVAGVWRQTL
jgi:hypothetical protein